MDKGRALVGLVIVIILLLPIIVLKLLSVLKERRLKASLMKFAQMHHATIIQYEHWNNSVIGLSNNGTHLFAITIDNSKVNNKMIRLSLFEQCFVVNDQPESGNKKQTAEMNTIKLELRRNSSTEQFCFYRREKDGTLTNEAELANKWCSMINNCINQRAWLYRDAQQ